MNRNPKFDVYEAFNTLDINNNGKITAIEVRRAMETRGFILSDKELNLIMRRLDADHDGVIRFNEVSKFLFS